MKCKINDNKAFTLVELLIAILILLIASIAIFNVFFRSMDSFNKEYQKLVSQIEFTSGLELLRADLTHSGYGIGLNLGVLPAEFLNGELILRSTFNPTNQKTRGWILVDCRNGIFDVKLDSREIKDTNQELVFLDINKNFVDNGTYGVCPENSILIAFPVDENTTTCEGQKCFEIKYKLSDTQNNPQCANDTKSLIRIVGDGVGEPVISCVKDFNVEIDYLRKSIIITLEVQEGDKTNNLSQSIKLSVKPMNW